MYSIEKEYTNKGVGKRLRNRPGAGYLWLTALSPAPVLAFKAKQEDIDPTMFSSDWRTVIDKHSSLERMVFTGWFSRTWKLYGLS